MRWCCMIPLCVFLIKQQFPFTNVYCIHLAPFCCAANFSEADSNKMMNKINFHATEVGRHESVLAMIGAVLDSTHRKYT